MSIKAVLFDLDGTLLPMDQDVFVKFYFGGLAKKLAPIGYEPEKLIKTIWQGTEVMVKNDGAKTNEERFWDFFLSVYGEKAVLDKEHFEEFYQNEFDKVKEACGFVSETAEVIKLLKDKGLRLVLATNPIFPSIATEKRMSWAGLNSTDFELYTTYENSKHAKPNIEYYYDILNVLNLKPEECLMVGNDVAEDMVAATIGMQVFLLTDCIINKNNDDISVYPNGNFDELLKFLENL